MTGAQVQIPIIFILIAGCVSIFKIIGSSTLINMDNLYEVIKKKNEIKTQKEK